MPAEKIEKFRRMAEDNPDNELARYSHLSSGVPGTVAGFYAAHRRYGSLPWKRLVDPAVGLARNGIVVSHDLANLLKSRRDRLGRFPAALRYFYKEGGVPYEAGERLVQSDLADSLTLIAEQGPDAFYRGEIAAAIAREMEANDGLIDADALAAYEPVFREPIEGTYRGFGIVSMPPSSSGGVHVIQMLNVLERFPVADLGPGSADNVHLLAEVMKRAFVGLWLARLNLAGGGRPVPVNA